MLDQYLAAIDDFTKAIELDGNNTSAYYNRALANKEFGQLEEAMKDFIIVKEINYCNILLKTQTAEALINKCRLYLRKNKLPDYESI